MLIAESLGDNIDFKSVIVSTDYHLLGVLPYQKFFIVDHFGGFDKDYSNRYLDLISSNDIEIAYEQYLDKKVRDRYPHIKFVFDERLHNKFHLYPAQDEYIANIYNIEMLNFEKLEVMSRRNNSKISKFLCCFNYAPHVGRVLLVSALYKMKLWDNETCTKYFSTNYGVVDGYIIGLSDNEKLDRKFLLDTSDEATMFYQTRFEMSEKVHQGWKKAGFSNFKNVKEKITKSFISLISETLSESYQPYVTEKFLFPTMASSIWIANAQPNYHKNLRDIYGFKLFDSLFDYSFDAIQNPITRMITLLSMISKFRFLTTEEWEDLQYFVKDILDFNRDHYFSGDYLKCLEKATYD